MFYPKTLPSLSAECPARPARGQTGPSPGLNTSQDTNSVSSEPTLWVTNVKEGGIRPVEPLSSADTQYCHLTHLLGTDHVPGPKWVLGREE